jgi:hypothetical protein
MTLPKLVNKTKANDTNLIFPLKIKAKDIDYRYKLNRPPPIKSKPITNEKTSFLSILTSNST